MPEPATAGTRSLARRAAPTLVTIIMIVAILAGFYGTRILAEEAADQDLAAAEESGFSVAAKDGDPGSGTSEATLESGNESTEDFDFFSDEPIAAEELIELPPEKSKWITVGGPIALMAFFFLQMFFYWWMVPFRGSQVGISLHDFPAGVQRGIAMALLLFGIAFCFGASEIWYQLRLHGTTEAYFEQMSLGKLIAFTHAHLFGFTTSFFIIGIPFSLQFNHVWQYQWLFPIGLAASLTDIISWWGIKYGAPSFEWVSMFCGIAFSISYLWMLLGLERVLLFPEVTWITDRDYAERKAKQEALDEEAKYKEGDF